MLKKTLKLNRIRPYDTLHDFECAFQVQVTGGAQPVLARAGGLGGMCLTEVFFFCSKAANGRFQFFCVSCYIYIDVFIYNTSHDLMICKEKLPKRTFPVGGFWEDFPYIPMSIFNQLAELIFWPKLDLSFRESSPKCPKHAGGYRRKSCMTAVTYATKYPLPSIAVYNSTNFLGGEKWQSISGSMSFWCPLYHLTCWWPSLVDHMKHVERVFLKNKLLTLPDFSHQQWIMSSNLLLVTTLFIPLLNTTQSHTFPSIHGGLKQELIHWQKRGEPK